MLFKLCGLSNAKEHPTVVSCIKHKSRLCAHGGQQTSNTHAGIPSVPAVQWTTLRTILTLCLIMQGLEGKVHSTDFVLAYPQADIKSNVFMQTYLLAFMLTNKENGY